MQKMKPLSMKHVLALLTLLCISVAFALPQYKPLQKTPITVNGEILSVDAPKKLMGVQFIMTVNGVRQEFRCEVRGAGKVQIGALGGTGWCYGKPVTLTDQWQPITVSYADKAPKLGFKVYNVQDAATTFEVRNATTTPQPPPQLQEADIVGKLFPAVERRTSQSKVQKVADALNGQAVWGRRWYMMVTLPVPANSRPLFYYARVKATDAAKRTRALRHTASTQLIVTATMADGTGWQWVKLGPVQTWMAFPTLTLTPLGPAGCEVLCDRVVLSTKADLTPAILDAVQ